jgi:hypothetical protein
MASYLLNDAAVAKARTLIDARQYVLDSDWGDVQPRAGLIACVYRASEWRHKDIEVAAHELLQHLDRKTGLEPTDKRRERLRPQHEVQEAVE